MTSRNIFSTFSIIALVCVGTGCSSDEGLSNDRTSTGTAGSGGSGGSTGGSSGSGGSTTGSGGTAGTGGSAGTGGTAGAGGAAGAGGSIDAGASDVVLLSCREEQQCEAACQSQSCATNCYNRATPAAQKLHDDLNTCIQTACAGSSDSMCSCHSQCATDGACRTINETCVEASPDPDCAAACP